MKNQKSEADIWRDFVQTEVKSKSKLGKILESSQYGGYEKPELTVYFPDENSRKAAQGQTEAIKKKLREYRLLCDRINFNFGSTTSTIVKNTPVSRANSTSVLRAPKNHNPLQALYWVEPNLPENDASQRMSILRETVAAEQGCNQIYTKLYQRTLQLADSKENTVSVSFNWRMRVGGTRGFRELLLPVLHPIFGIPYIPASTLKGAAKAWARKNDAPARVQELLGMLNGRDAKAAKIEFLDAFPTKHCLSIDVATPQWAWNDNKVMYGPVPHPLLSLEQPQFLIGLRPTSRQNSDSIQDDIKTVKSWLENALNSGIGSRVSSGYGKALGTTPITNTRKSYDFELWTQGIYGSNPPSRENNYQGTTEFRPSAVRGILRYWFRAVALGLYDVPTCQKLEEEIFGNLGKQGQISLSTKVNPSNKKDPCFYAGKIYLEATEIKYLNLAEKLLFLAVQLGGVGRGSRRPLHLLNRRMRGCHWEIVGKDLPLHYDGEQWRQFFTELKQVFQAIKTPIGSYAVSPGKPRAKQQDVLDKNAQIWLLKSPSQIYPEKVNWQTDGSSSKVRGAGLELLYSDTRFKGKGQGQGNTNVGGELGTPSFVWIKSIFTDSLPYQVITIFGSDYPDRQEFAKELKKQGAILVFGEISPNKSVISPPIKKK